MANRDLRRADFCRSKTRLQLGVDLQAPLDTTGLLGLASLGCHPLISHLRDVSTDVLSRVNQNTGALTDELLTSISDSGFIFGSPTLFDNTPAPTIAGLRAAPALVGAGTVVIPPVTVPSSLFTWSVGGAALTKVQNGSSLSLASDPTAFNRLLFRGFGSLASGGNLYVEFPAESGQEWTGTTNVRANHAYIPFLSLPFVPSLQPLGVSFDLALGYRILPSSAFIGVKQVMACVAEVYSLQVAPCLIECNGDIPPNPFGEPNGPSLTRKYCHHRFTGFTAPSFGGSITQTYDIDKSKCRGFVCIYADSSRVTGVSLSPGAALGASGVSVPTITETPAASFPAPAAGWNFDTVYQFDVAGTEAAYDVAVTSPAGTITITGFVPWSGNAHVRCFEMFVDAHAAGNPNLACS